MNAARRAVSAALRIVVRLVKRSPLLTRVGWRLAGRFPGLANRVLRVPPVDYRPAPVLIVPASAWNRARSSSDHIAQRLAAQLQRDQSKS